MSRSTQESPPPGWTSYPFWAIATEKVISGRESEGLLSVYLDRGVIPYSEGGGLVHKPAESLEKYQLVEPGDFVMNNQQAWRGSVGVSKHRGIVSPAYLVFSLDKSRLLPEYASYMFRDKSYVEKYMLSSLSVGDIQRQIKWNHLRKITIHLPSKEEQQALVKYLDHETPRIDALIEKKTRFIELLKEKRQAIVTQAVTKGLSSSAPMVDSGVEWLGLVPAHWKIMRCSNFLFEIKRKNDLMQSENYLSLMANKGIIPYAEKGDVGNKKPEDLSKCKLVEVGDFVINSMNYSIGSYGRSNHRGICSPVYVILRHRINVVESDYVDLILSNSSFQQYAQSFGTGILDHRRAIGWDEIKKISVAVPPIEEQIEISRKIHRETKKINSLIKKTEESISLLIEHRSALIAAAVTGKIDVRISK